MNAKRLPHACLGIAAVVSVRAIGWLTFSDHPTRIATKDVALSAQIEARPSGWAATAGAARLPEHGRCRRLPGYRAVQAFATPQPGGASFVSSRCPSSGMGRDLEQCETDGRGHGRLVAGHACHVFQQRVQGPIHRGNDGACSANVATPMATQKKAESVTHAAVKLISKHWLPTPLRCKVQVQVQVQVQPAA